MRVRYPGTLGEIDVVSTDVELVFTGPLVVAANPVEPKDISNKGFVDSTFQSLDASGLSKGTLNSTAMPEFSGDVVSAAGSAAFTLVPSGVVDGTYTKVTVDSKGRVIGGEQITVSDIPPLDWTKITRNTPTTLSGYGITDGVLVSGDTLNAGLYSSVDPIDPLDAATAGYVDAALKTLGSPAQPGTVVTYPVAVTPFGFLRCNGGALDKTTYADLYAVIGDTFTATADQQPGVGQPWQQQYDINTIQSASIVGWTTGGSLPAKIYGAQAVVTKNRVYLLGGVNSSGTTVNTVYTAPINADGTLGTWTTGTSLPGPLSHSQAIVTKNRVYLLGGDDGTQRLTTTVYTAPINTDGTLGDWSLGENLSISTSRHKAVITKNWVYLLGGYNGYTISRAPISIDGTLGTWVTDSSSLPDSITWSPIAVTKNRIYILGGDYTSGNVIYTCVIKSDGTLGSWSSAGYVPNGVGGSGTSVTVTRNTVYILGGALGSLTYSAPINPDGTIGTWTQGESLPDSRAWAGCVVVKNMIYLIGGYIPANATGSDTVYAASFSGGSNDYSLYYDGAILPLSTASTDFRLPDYTGKETQAKYFYIKY